MNTENNNQNNILHGESANPDGKRQERIGLYKHLGTTSFAAFVYLGGKTSSLTCLEKFAIICMVISTLSSMYSTYLLVAYYASTDIAKDTYYNIKKNTVLMIVSFVAGLICLLFSVIIK